MATIRDIAQHSGYSKTAVSLALRNDPRIPGSTRTEILAAAHALGYRANPVFAHMMRSVRESGALHAKATLGLLHGFPERDPSRSIPYHADLVAGARARAEELGYTLDELWMEEPGMSARRLSNIIRARGIRAVLIAPLPERRGVELDWDDFSAVTAGYSVLTPRLSRVVPNHQQATLLSLRQLAQRGYRRVGLLLDPRMDPHVRYSVSAPFLWFREQMPAAYRLPILTVAPNARSEFVRWLRKHRPEAVIVPLRPLADWVRAEQPAVPDEIGVVCTQHTAAPPDFCCVNQQPRKLGAAAIDLLVGQVHRGEFGLPSNPKTVFTDGAWQEGTSLRQVREPLALQGWGFL